jgi:cytochrome c553
VGTAVLGRTLLLAFALAACGTDIQSFSGDAGNNLGGGGSAGDGLPCDVQSVLQAHCTSCHGNPPNGAPISLVTYADLAAASPYGGTVAQRAYARMTSATSPMPPGSGVTVPSADIATFKSWLDAGMPTGSCGASVGPDPLNAAPTCTSGTFWNLGNEGSSRMHPGDACIACHRQSGGEAPTFTIAGTVYPTGHEPAECYGTSGAQVVITDNTGRTLTLTPNSAGNFYSTTALAFPIRAKVVVNGQERVMATAQTSGDCNACHTQNGTSMAPGRVTVP